MRLAINQLGLGGFLLVPTGNKDILAVDKMLVKL
jgi:hypothetical protein